MTNNRFNVRIPVYCEKPKVTVIVPVYKVDKYLVACLNSIVNQTLDELEIIIVDEGDKDRCREIIDYFESADPRIKAPHDRHGGYGASVNYGIKMARGEYLAIVEPDDFIEPEMYEEMYEYAKALDADVVKTPYYEYFSGREKKVCNYRDFMRERVPCQKVFSVRDFGEMLQVHASLWSGLYKTSYMHENAIQFVEAKGTAYVDVGFRIQTLIHTNRIAWLDKAYYNYRVDSENSSTNKFKLMPMLERWGEAHEFFVSCQEDYDRRFGPYLILDEYLNTLGWASLMEISKDELEKMSRNFSYVKDTVINKSPALDERQKQEILEFKSNPDLTMEKLQQRARLRNRNPFSTYLADDRFTFPYSSIQPKSKVVIYGGGIVGKTFLYQLGVTRYCDVLAVCDSHPGGTGIHELPVITLPELSRWSGEPYDCIVIAIEKAEIAAKIEQDLKDAGISKDRIVWMDPAL